MATKSNFILKVQDAKLADVQKALKDANITVVSILEVHKEEVTAERRELCFRGNERLSSSLGRTSRTFPPPHSAIINGVQDCMKVTLAELETVANALSVKVTYEDLKASKGGSCRVLETRRIIINKHLQTGEKINILARELGRFDLAGTDIPESVKKKIRQESESAVEA